MLTLRVLGLRVCLYVGIRGQWAFYAKRWKCVQTEEAAADGITDYSHHEQAIS